MDPKAVKKKRSVKLKPSDVALSGKTRTTVTPSSKTKTVTKNKGLKPSEIVELHVTKGPTKRLVVEKKPVNLGTVNPYHPDKSKRN